MANYRYRYDHVSQRGLETRDELIANGKVVFRLGQDAEGDMYYRHNGVMVRLAAGSPGMVLTVDNGLPEWGELPEEGDPVWLAEKGNYYTKIQLQTPGQGQVHWNNIIGPLSSAITMQQAGFRFNFTGGEVVAETATAANKNAYVRVLTGGVGIGASYAGVGSAAFSLASGQLTLHVAASSDYSTITVVPKEIVVAQTNGVYKFLHVQQNLSPELFILAHDLDGRIYKVPRGTITANQQISLTGDVVGSGTNSIQTTVSNGAITWNKIQNLGPNQIFGRSGEALGVGSGAAITLGAGFNWVANTLFVQDNTTVQRVQVWHNSASVGDRRRLHFTDNASGTWTITDDSINQAVNIQFNAGTQSDDIRNQSASAQAATFHISGNGIAGAFGAGVTPTAKFHAKETAGNTNAVLLEVIGGNYDGIRIQPTVSGAYALQMGINGWTGAQVASENMELRVGGKSGALTMFTDGADHEINISPANTQTLKVSQKAGEPNVKVFGSLNVTGPITAGGAAHSHLDGAFERLVRNVNSGTFMRLPYQKIQKKEVYDVDYVVESTVELVAFVTLTAPRTVVLPNDQLGRIICIVDESGNAGTHNIVIAPAVGTINGVASITINTANGAVWVYSNGTHWRTIGAVASSSPAHTHGVANSSGVQQFTFGASENIQFEGLGTVSVSFDPVTKKVVYTGSQSSDIYNQYLVDQVASFRIHGTGRMYVNALVTGGTQATGSIADIGIGAATSYGSGAFHGALSAANRTVASGSTAIPNSNIYSGTLSQMILNASAAATITVSQGGTGAGVRAVSAHGVQVQILKHSDAFSSTITHLAAMQIFPMYHEPNAVSQAWMAVTNYYGLLVCDQGEHLSGPSPTNRWAIYQAGTGDKNHFAGKTESANDIEITNTNYGLILKSPNGTRYRVKVDDAGALVVAAL